MCCCSLLTTAEIENSTVRVFMWLLSIDNLPTQENLIKRTEYHTTSISNQYNYDMGAKEEAKCRCSVYFPLYSGAEEM